MVRGDVAACKRSVSRISQRAAMPDPVRPAHSTGYGYPLKSREIAGDTAVAGFETGSAADVDRNVEGIAGSAHALGLLDLVIAQGGIGTGFPSDSRLHRPLGWSRPA